MTDELEMKASRYLSRLKFMSESDELPEATLETLTHLMAAQLSHVCFENIDLILDKPIPLTPPELYKKIVLEGRGGICYELTILFHWLLLELGFKATLTTFQTRLDKEKLIFKEFDGHATIIVEINNHLYLTDVGWGCPKISFVPLELTTEYTRSEQPNGRYEVGLASDGWWHVGRKDSSKNGESNTNQYYFFGRVRLQAKDPQCFERALEEYRDPRLTTWPEGNEELEVVIKTEGGCVGWSLHASALKRHLLSVDDYSKEVFEEVTQLETLKRVLKEFFLLQPQLSEEEEQQLLVACNKKPEDRNYTRKDQNQSSQ